MTTRVPVLNDPRDDTRIAARMLMLVEQERAKVEAILTGTSLGFDRYNQQFGERQALFRLQNQLQSLYDRELNR
jgi:hypothetical protein